MMDWTLPAQLMGPPEAAEEHEWLECEFCGELQHPDEGCLCALIEARVYDKLEAGE